MSELTRDEFVQHWAELLVEAGLFDVVPRDTTFNVTERRGAVMDFGSGPVDGRWLKFRFWVGDKDLSIGHELSGAFEEYANINVEQFVAENVVRKLREWQEAAT